VKKLENYKGRHRNYGIVFGVLNLAMFLSVSDSTEHLTCIIHESLGFVNKHLPESRLLSGRFRRGVLHLAQG